MLGRTLPWGPIMTTDIETIGEIEADMQRWRHDIHAHPETAFEEVRTSQVVADLLSSWGIEVHRGLAVTGVVCVLHGAGGPGKRCIGLRADMDALNMEERKTVPWRSRHAGKMHGCGHDGHTTMLLGRRDICRGRAISTARSASSSSPARKAPGARGA